MPQMKGPRLLTLTFPYLLFLALFQRYLQIVLESLADPQQYVGGDIAVFAELGDGCWG